MTPIRLCRELMRIQGPGASLMVERPLCRKARQSDPDAEKKRHTVAVWAWGEGRGQVGDIARAVS